LYSSPNINTQIKARGIRWAPTGEERKVFRFLVEKPKGKRPLVRPRRWTMDLRDIAWKREVDSNGSK
jgi:hypothetical protein